MEPWLPFVLYLAPILILLVQPHLFTDAASQTNRLRAGSDMRTTEYLTSSSGTFAFGFCNFNPSLSPNHFLLAIWFNFDAPESTNKKVVWFLRDLTSNSVVIARKHTILTFTANGQLFLHDDQMLLWTNAKLFGSDLVLQDSGNLQLLANGGAVLWQSFDYPSDTLLPGQSMTNQPERYLQSKNTDADFSPGRFTLMVQDDGNIVLYMRDPDLPIDARDPYWATGMNEIGMVPTLFFSDSGTLYYNLSRAANGSVMHNLTALQPPDSAERYYNTPHWIQTAPSASMYAQRTTQMAAVTPCGRCSVSSQLMVAAGKPCTVHKVCAARIHTARYPPPKSNV